MKIIETTQYVRTRKKILKKYYLLQSDIDATLALFNDKHDDASLHYKKMNCKKDKDRHSIRIQNTQYRILMTVNEDEAFFVCICDHDDYDRRNKNC